MNVEGDEVISIDKNAEIVLFPPTVRYINDCACSNGSITKLYIEDTSIIIIGRESFQYCHKLHSVSFPKSLEEICANAFENCENLVNINFPTDSALYKIGASAFGGCYRLGAFEFPPLLEIIENGAFYGNSIRNFDLRSTKIHQIGEKAFSSSICSIVSLPITVPLQSIKNISCCQLIIDDRHPFVKMDESGSIYVINTMVQGNRIQRHFVIRRGIEKISNNCFNLSKLVLISIPASVIDICQRAFANCYKLQLVHFERNSRLKKIRDFAFNNCYSLKKIKFPRSLKKIGESAFNKCTSLENVSFPQDSQLEMFQNSFPYTKIKHLSIPPSVQEIDSFSGEMKYLESIYISNDLFKSNKEGTAIFSKDGCELICVVSSLLSFDIPESVRVIGCDAFSYSSINGSLLIPASVEVIDDYAFNECENLEILEFEAGSRLSYLGESALPPLLKCFTINNEHFQTLENGDAKNLDTNEILFHQQAQSDSSEYNDT